jgi:hypothetical protein
MPIFELQTPDGRTLEIDAPDIDTAVRSLGAFRGGKTEAGQDRGAITDAIQQFGENFNRGLYATVNAPTTLANAATKALGIHYQFKRPLEAAAPGIDREIMEVPEAQTAVGHVAGTVGEYVGANTIPAGVTIAMAPRLAAATAGSTGLLGQTANRMATSVTAAPGTAATGELVSTVGAGIGAQLAKDIAPGSDMAEFLGATAGGIAAPGTLWALTGGPTRKVASAARKRFSPNAIAKQQKKQIVSEVERNMTPESRRAVDETLEILDVAPDYRPSVAEATENPSFIATQREFEAGLSGPDLDNAARRYSRNDVAISRAVRDMAPDSGTDLNEAFAAGKKRVSGLTAKADDQLLRLDQRQAAVSDSLRSGKRQRELGRAIRDDLILRRGDMREEMALTARQMGLNETDARFPFASVKERLVKSVEPRSKLSDASAVPSAIVDDIRSMDDTASIVDLMELRTRVTTDIREAARTPSGEKRLPYLQKLKTEIDGATDQLIEAVGDSDLARNLQQFRRLYREDFVLPYEQGAAARVLKTDVAGAYAVPDEKVAREFFSGWNETAANQFKKIFPQSATARVAMERAALDDLYHFAVRDGVVQPGLINSWVRKNAGVLNDFPEIRQRLTATERSLSAIAERRAALISRKRAIENSVFAREVARIENLTGTPEQAVTQAIKNPKRMQRIVRGLKTEDAQTALARNVWDTALESTNPRKFLGENADAIKIALGEERFAAAKKLARAIEKNRIVPRPSGQSMDTNPLADVESYLGTGLNQISSRVFAVKSGRTSSRYALADIAGRAFRTMTARQARDTLRDALYDPEIARDLANTIEMGTTSERALKRIYAFLISNGIVATAPGDSEEFGPEEKKPLELTVRPNRDGAAGQ